jgi:hypothetical protein
MSLIQLVIEVLYITPLLTHKHGEIMGLDLSRTNRSFSLQSRYNNCISLKRISTDNTIREKTKTIELKKSQTVLERD